MKHTHKNDEAVSPVIGVILMVAITVILAAVIAAFVFGMAGDIQRNKIVAATAQQPDATSIIVTYQGGQDSSTCDSIKFDVTPAAGPAMNITISGIGDPAIVPVGSAHTFKAVSPNSFSGKDHVVAIAHFTDGSSQVVMDNTI